MTDAVAAPVRLVLPGHDPRPARLEVVQRPRRARTTRAVLIVLATLVLAPLAALLPPHIPWALGVLAAGLYLANRHFRGEWEVRGFEGSCPRCEAPLALPAGARIGLPHVLTCFACHHQPRLEVEPGRA